MSMFHDFGWSWSRRLTDTSPLGKRPEQLICHTRFLFETIKFSDSKVPIYNGIGSERTDYVCPFLIYNVYLGISSLVNLLGH